MATEPTAGELIDAKFADLERRVTKLEAEPPPEPPVGPPGPPAIVCYPPGREMVMARSASQDDVQAAIRGAPDRAIVVMPNGEPEWPRTLAVSRDIGLMAENPGGVTIKTVGAGREKWTKPVIQVGDSDAFHHQDFDIIGDADEDPLGEVVGITTRGHDVYVTGYNVHLSRFTWSAFSIMENSRGSYLLECSASDNYRDLGGGKYSMGYGVEVGGVPGNWDRPLTNGAGEVLGAVVIQGGKWSNNRHHVASNNGSRYLLLDALLECDRSYWGAMVDMHGDAAWPRGSHYAGTFGCTLKGTGGGQKPWVGLGPRGGIMHAGDNILDGIGHPIMILEEDGQGNALAPDHHRDLHFFNNMADGQPITEVEYDTTTIERLISPMVSMTAPEGFVPPKRITRNELMMMAA